MQNENHAAVWLHCGEYVSIGELIALSGLTEEEVSELVEAGALNPANRLDRPWTFGADCVVIVRQAARLRDDLELDTHAMAVTVGLLAQIRALEAQLSQLRARQSEYRLTEIG